MQDQDKWRDRVELSLDNRQIFLIFSAMAVVLALVFALGVVVGKRTALDAPHKPATDPLALLDQISGEQADEERRLTFPEALGRTHRRPSAVGKVAPVRPPELPSTGKKGPGPSGKQPKAAVARPKAPAALPGASAATPEAEGDRPSVATKSSPKAARRPTPVAPGPVGRVDQAVGDGSGATQYTLQLSSFQDRLEAEQFMERLRSGGLKPRMVPTEIPGRGRWYRVRLGAYASWDQALAAKEAFERSHDVIAYVARQ